MHIHIVDMIRHNVDIDLDIYVNMQTWPGGGLHNKLGPVGSQGQVCQRSIVVEHNETTDAPLWMWLAGASRPLPATRNAVAGMIMYHLLLGWQAGVTTTQACHRPQSATQAIYWADNWSFKP